MQHCHNTQHEDNSMLLRWDIERPGQFQLMATPLPTWDGVNYTPSQGLPTFRTGDGSGVNKVGPVLPAPALPALVITSATSPSNGAPQTITGVVQLGTPPPVVTATGTAVVGPVTVNGSLWSCKLSGLPPGDTTITATVNWGCCYHQDGRDNCDPSRRKSQTDGEPGYLRRAQGNAHHRRLGAAHFQ